MPAASWGGQTSPQMGGMLVHTPRSQMLLAQGLVPRHFTHGPSGWGQSLSVAHFDEPLRVPQVQLPLTQVGPS